MKSLKMAAHCIIIRLNNYKIKVYPVGFAAAGNHFKLGAQ